MNNKVVIIGDDHHNTLGVIASFGQKGIKPYVVLHTDRKEAYVLHSRFVENGWCCKDDDTFLKCLIDNFNDISNKAVIIATNDKVASIIDMHYDVLKDFFYMPITSPAGTISEKMSKEYMTCLASKVGYCVPKSWVVKDDIIPSDIEYPVITKAISSIKGTKNNIRVCEGENELKMFLSSEKQCSTIQIQQYIDKDYEFQLLGCSLRHGEEIIIPGRTHINRPNGMDNTFFLRFDKCELELHPIIEKAKVFIKETGYSGLFSIEFLRGKNGVDYFTEMNFRNDGNAYCVTRAGTNMPYIFYLSQIGHDYKAELNISKVNKTYLCPDVYYFTCLLSGEISFKEWYNNMRKVTCYTTYHNNDKKPFFWFIWFAFKRRIFKSNS